MCTALYRIFYQRLSLPEPVALVLRGPVQLGIAHVALLTHIRVIELGAECKPQRTVKEIYKDLRGHETYVKSHGVSDSTLLSESRSLNRDLAVLVPESRGQLRPLECTASAS